MTNEYPPNIYGGAGVHVQHLAAALAGLTRVEVRCFGGRPAAGQAPARGFVPDAHWLEHVDPRLRKVLGPMAADLEMAAIPVATDVVHCHTWYTMFAGFLARMLHGRPLVATVHSLEPSRPWKEEQLGRGYALSTWLERTGLTAADLVIAVSAGMREDILRAHPVDPGRVRVIHNGIDTDLYRPAAAMSALERRGIAGPYILFVGRISRQKGIDVLLAAAPLLPRGLGVVVCAGAADTPELAAAMREAASALPNVHWLEEMLPVPDLVELYSHAAVFVCPSVYEPFGLINLEAMACARPVVASRVGGIPEVVVDGETGILVPPGEPAALAAAVGRLLENAGKAAAMGAAGRRRVEDLFTWRAVARRTLEVYEEAVSLHRMVSSEQT
ncbi:MAG: glycogen synthase [Patescibacteria group bacterium]